MQKNRFFSSHLLSCAATAALGIAIIRSELVLRPDPFGYCGNPRHAEAGCYWGWPVFYCKGTIHRAHTDLGRTTWLTFERLSVVGGVVDACFCTALLLSWFLTADFYLCRRACTFSLRDVLLFVTAVCTVLFVVLKGRQLVSLYEQLFASDLRVLGAQHWHGSLGGERWYVQVPLIAGMATPVFWAFRAAVGLAERWDRARPRRHQ